MTISFSHEVSPAGFNLLTIKTNNDIEVAFYFEQDGDSLQESPDTVMVGDYELDCADAVLSGLFVYIGKEVVSLKALAAQAAADWPDIREEIEQDGREAADMERELSSPYLTGRI